jgi:PAS domain S-box-containing protein
MKTFPLPKKNAKRESEVLQPCLAALEQEQARLREELALVQGQRDQYLDFLEQAADIIYWIDARGYFTYVNGAAERLVGYSKEELVGRHYLTLLRPDYRDEAARFYGKQFVYKNSNTYYEFPIITRSGSELWIGQNVQMIGTVDSVEGFRAVARDMTGQKQIEEGWKKYQEQLETTAEARTYELVKKNRNLELEISERKQMETALLASEEKYRSILETIEDGYFEVDLAGNLTFFNDVLIEILGYPRNELGGMNNRQYTDAENARKLFQQFNRVYKTGQSSKSCEYEIIHRSGQKKVLDSSVSLIKDDLGFPSGFRGIVRDITDRKKAEKTLRLAKEEWEQTFDSVPDLMAIVGDDFRISRVNRAMGERLNLNPNQISGKYCYEVFHGSQQPVSYCPHQKIISEKIEISVEIEEPQLKGCFFLTANLLARTNSVIHVFRDITERKKDEELIKKSEERFKVQYQNNPIPTVTWQKTGKDFELIDCNQAALGVSKGKIAQLIGKKNSEMFNNKKNINDDFERCFLEQTVISGEMESTIFLPGREITTTLAYIPPDLVLLHFQDITDRKRAEETLQKTHDRIALLLNSISAILIAVSEDNQVVFWNTTAAKEFGIPGKGAEGKSLTELGIQWDGDRLIAAVSRCRRESSSLDLDNLKFLQQNGQGGWLGIRITPMVGEREGASGRMVLIQGANITQRMILESQLTQAQKLESIGQLAAGIAHEINTPTQYVGDNVRFLQTSFEDINRVLRQYELLMEAFKEGRTGDSLIQKVDEAIQEADLDYLTEEIPKAFQQTLDGLDRVSRIVHSMKAFAHPGKEEKVLTDLNRAIENTLVVARNEWKYVSDVQTDLDPSLPLVSCIPGDINQVLLNILVNAAQAVAEVVGDGANGKGTITIATRRDDSWAEIRISDTGKGIPEGVRSKIFDPFFTTKEVGKGTGQGLAISHTAIVGKHQGSLSFNTEINRGTTFIVRLPLEEGRDG